MFQGETAITIDDKGRLAIPTAYRELVARECGNQLVLTYNPFDRGCLLLYPQAEWERVRAELQNRPNTTSAVRVLQRQLLASAAFLSPDGNGRVGLPASHRNAVGIERKAVLLGMGNKFELWSEQAHREVVQQTLSDGDLGGALLDLTL